jgi:glycosyltransferase involved in cell wall biosynthesis
VGSEQRAGLGASLGAGVGTEPGTSVGAGVGAGVAVYCDFPYRRHEGRVYAEQAFATFLGGLSQFTGKLVLIGRLDPLASAWHFELPDSVEYVPLPHYERLTSPLGVLGAVGRSIRRFWRVLDEVEAVWLFGPNPMAVVFALVAFSRRRRVALGIRQEYMAYVRNRHPGRRSLHFAARLLDAAFRLLARRSSVVVVGPALAERYARAGRLLALSVVLVGEQDVIPDSSPPAASPGKGLTVLSVGRLDNEKNPLLLADALAELCAGAETDPCAGTEDDSCAGAEDDWRLTVCGEGPLEDALRERLRTLGVSDRATLRGFVPAGPRLHELYRNSDLFLHASHTEGVPQVLFEAFASGLPVVATDVGGVAATARDAALLIPPDDPGAAASALRRLAGDEQLRAQLTRAGLRIVRASTRELQCRRVAEFLLGAQPDGDVSWNRAPPAPARRQPPSSNAA